MGKNFIIAENVLQSFEADKQKKLKRLVSSQLSESKKFIDSSQRRIGEILEIEQSLRDERDHHTKEYKSISRQYEYLVSKENELQKRVSGLQTDILDIQKYMDDSNSESTLLIREEMGIHNHRHRAVGELVNLHDLHSKLYGDLLSSKSRARSVLIEEELLKDFSANS
jgi:septal ring factor EnvC (AmiA/AmiB activator)